MLNVNGVANFFKPNYFFLIIFNRLFFSGIWDNKKMQKSAFDIYKDSATRSSTNIRTVYSNGG